MIKIINRKSIYAAAVSIVMLASGTFPAAFAATSKPQAPPSGTQQGNPPSKPQGNPPSKPNGAAPGNTSSSSSSVKTSGVYSQNGKTAAKSNKSIKSTTKNKSCVIVTNKGKLTLTGCKLIKSGNTTSEDSSNFYGLNAGVLAESASKITLKNCKIATTSSGSNGVFATGANSTINLSNVTINTTSDSSRGLDATFTGTVIAKNTNITTKGTHCAGLATDRGNGTISLTGGKVTTHGTDSPAIYSTGKISATNATLTATGSEAAVVEGKNSITVINCKLSGSKKNGVMLYQSFSGDAETGTSYINMIGGTLTAAKGSLFYITNTDSIINLKGVKASEKSGVLLTATADRWGTTGSNGGIVTLNATSQTLSGTVTADKISTVAILLKNNSTLKSTVNKANTAKSVTLSLDASSKWNVTGTSYLTSFTDKSTSLSNIIDNGHTIYYNSKSNKWLGGKTYKLKEGGKLIPYTK